MKKVYPLFLVIFLMAWFAGCSDSSESGPSAAFELDDEHDMVHVVPNGATVTLGTRDKEAKISETPQMRVQLDYDFFMDIHETTCGEFNSLMKLQVKCDNDSLPVSNVSFYDAVLYANARSNAEKLDTAYRYEKAVFDANGHCLNLEGYIFNPDVNAYRLPTEAEWTLVAAKDWNLKNAWTGDNSNFVPHKVCSKPKTKAGVCDIAGNMMEWINDWKSSFTDTTILNYVGAPNGGSSGERIVKGGSYRNLSVATKIYNRGDVYVVTSGTKSEYVGFRLVLGAISDPSWMDGSGCIQENRMHILANAATVRSKLKNYKAKLFFRNDLSGNLSYIDYSRGSLSVVEFKDSLTAYHPDVSPDGKWVAFSTGIEGVPRKSTLYVRSVEKPLSAAIKLDVESAAVPRWRVLETGDTVIVYVTSAADNSDRASFMESSTWQVQFSKGKFGIPEKLMSGAYHGGMDDASLFAVTGSKLLRAHIRDSRTGDFVDTVWYNGEQACNVSLFRDGTKRTSFLDFAGKAGHEYTGDENYDVHERLLVVDSLGKLIQSVAAPQNYAFDHSEWVDENLVVATLTNSQGAHTKIVLIDLADSSITNLVEGDELWHPCLWTLRNTSLSTNVLPYSDSAGMYYQEHGEEYQFVLRDKMEKFWKLKDSVTIVAMGSSRTLFAVHEKYFKDEIVLNMAYPGADLHDAKFIIHNYVFNHAKKLKFFILELAPDMFFRTVDYHWIPTYENNPGFPYDEKHNFWKDGVPEGFIDAVESAPRIEDRSRFVYDQEYQLPPKSWGPADILMDSVLFINSKDIIYPSLTIYKGLVDAALELGVSVIAVVLPRHPGYKKTGTYGACGPSRTIAKEVIDSVSHMNVVVLDENKWGDHDYSDSMAFDYDHLSYLGAEQVSHRLDSLIKTLK